jgi:hypothetical protein
VTKPGKSDPAEPSDSTEGKVTPPDDDTSSLAPEPAEPESTERESAEPESAEPKLTAPESTATAPEPAPVPVTEPAPVPAPKPKARPRVEKAPPIPADEPVMPTAHEAAMRARAKRRFEEPAPRTLRISFYFFVASGLIWLASMVVSLLYKQELIDAEVKRNTNPELSPDQIAGGVTQILWIVLIASLAFTVFLGLFGWKATEGTRRARSLVTIFGVVLVLFHLLLNGTPPGILSAMFCLVGLALLWSPSARRYFPSRERR